MATGLPNVSLQHWKLCSFYVLKQNRFYFNVRVLMNLGIVTDEKISMQLTLICRFISRKLEIIDLFKIQVSKTNFSRFRPILHPQILSHQTFLNSTKYTKIISFEPSRWNGSWFLKTNFYNSFLSNMNPDENHSLRSHGYFHFGKKHLSQGWNRDVDLDHLKIIEVKRTEGS